MSHYKIVSSKIEVNFHLTAVFEYIFKRDLLFFFNELSCVPLFTYTPFVTAKVRPGFEHMIYFADGSSLKRRLLTFKSDTSFTVSIEDLDLYFQWGLREIEYCYYFSESDIFEGCTQIISEYKFKFRSRIWKSFFHLNAEKTVQRHLDVFLKQLHDDCIIYVMYITKF